MAEHTVHVAGSPDLESKTQECRRCGYVLTDNRRMMAVAGTPGGPAPTEMLWWPDGAHVAVSRPNGSFAGTRDLPPTCEPSPDA